MEPADHPPADVLESPSHSRPRWFPAAALVLLGVLAGVAGVAVASDRTTPATPAAATGDQQSQQQSVGTEHQQHGKGHRHGHAQKQSGGNGGKHLLRGAPGRSALYGEFVVAADVGKYQTLAVQRGEVTSVSATSISLRSSDGYTKTYVVTADTSVQARGRNITSIAKGTSARVVALKEGSTYTAQLIHAHPKHGAKKGST